MFSGWIFFFFGIWIVISAAISGLNYWTNVVDFVIGIIIAVYSFFLTKKGKGR
jgi:hypothetical protein